MGNAKGVKRSKASPRSTLEMNLFAPGMTVLHRAGLGGLACTLRFIERAYEIGSIADEEVPGGPWADKPPWTRDERSIRLDFGGAEAAGEFLRKLFQIAFALKDGLINLPGQYEIEPSLAVRAELQLGLALTFLQHGKVRNLAKEPTVIHHDPDGNGRDYIAIEYKRCTWYKHQDGWKDLVDKNGRLSNRAVDVIGPLNPGAIVRHVAFNGPTKITDSVERVLPLYFAMVGCLALPTNKAVGALVAPVVEDVEAFARDRPLITPTSVKECRVTSPADGAWQAMLRLRSRGTLDDLGVPGCYAARFEPTSWASQQKSRTAVLLSEPVDAVHRFEPDVVTDDERRLDQFGVALANLQPRVVMRKAHVRPSRKQKTNDDEAAIGFMIDSVVRPLVANNLAQNKPWYSGFTTLMTAIDSGGRALRDSVAFEQKGLNTMIEKIRWDQNAEGILVEAVHQAIAFNLGRIRRDTDGQKPLSQATKNRWNRFKEQLRLSLVGAKTADQCRGAVCTLFGKSGTNPALKEKWRIVLPMLTDGQRWQAVRDVALLALASYSGQGTSDEETAPSIDE